MGDAVDVIYLDFQKAFDKVPHKRLLMKLEAYGVRGCVSAWIANRLSGREQRVVLNNCSAHCSSAKKISVGTLYCQKENCDGEEELRYRVWGTEVC